MIVYSMIVVRMHNCCSVSVQSQPYRRIYSFSFFNSIGTEPRESPVTLTLAYRSKSDTESGGGVDDPVSTHSLRHHSRLVEWVKSASARMEDCGAVCKGWCAYWEAMKIVSSFVTKPLNATAIDALHLMP